MLRKQKTLRKNDFGGSKLLKVTQPFEQNDKFRLFKLFDPFIIWSRIYASSFYFDNYTNLFSLIGLSSNNTIQVNDTIITI